MAFGEFALGDAMALAAFLDAHNRRHMQYARVFKLPGGSLEGPVNGDWMQRHWARHVALAKAAKTTAATAVLALPGVWRTAAELADWQSFHNRLHSHLDRVAGLANVRGSTHGS